MPKDSLGVKVFTLLSLLMALCNQNDLHPIQVSFSTSILPHNSLSLPLPSRKLVITVVDKEGNEVKSKELPSKVSTLNQLLGIRGAAQEMVHYMWITKERMNRAMMVFKEKFKVAKFQQHWTGAMNDLELCVDNVIIESIQFLPHVVDRLKANLDIRII